MRFWKRRRNGWSRLHGLLVAPITYIFRFLPLPLIPSISVRNWFLVRTSPPTSLLREPSSESTSSTNSMTGLSSFSVMVRAIENTFETFFSASPSHLLIMDAASTFTKYPSISLAVAAASMVLPHPGGPYSSMPRGHPSGNRSARFVGYTMDSRRAFFASSSPTTSSQLMSGFSFITRSSKSLAASCMPMERFCSSGEAPGSTTGSTPWAPWRAFILFWYEAVRALYVSLSLLAGYSLISFTRVSMAFW